MWVAFKHLRTFFLGNANQNSRAHFLMSTPGMEGKAKVLCLHGFTQNAETFRAKTGSVRKHLKSKLEFVFVDAPHSAAGFFDQSDAASLGTTSDGVHENHAGPRAWWLMGENDGTQESRENDGSKPNAVTETLAGVALASGDMEHDAVVDTMGSTSLPETTDGAKKTETETNGTVGTEYRRATKPKVRPAASTCMVGWEATAGVIRSAVTEHGPFTGVVGFSQGASTAALALATMPELASVKWTVLFSGFEPRDARVSDWLHTSNTGAEGDTEERLYSPAIKNIRSLHVHGVKDTMVTKDRTEALMRAFEETPALFEHDGGHGVPSSKPFRDAMKQFVLAE